MTKIYRDWNEQKKTAEIKTGIQSVKCRDKFSGKYIRQFFHINKKKKRKYFGAVLFMFLLWNGWKNKKKNKFDWKNGETVFYMNYK